MFVATPRHSRLVAAHLGFAVSLALSMSACDKGTHAKEVKAEPTKRATDEEAKKKADEEAKKKADEEAKKKADEETKKKADEEAKKKADEEAKKPIALSDITVKGAGGMFGGSSGALQLTAKGKFNEQLNTGTFVHAKALCKRDNRIITDVTSLSSTDYTKQLHQYAVGESIDLQGQIFTQGAETAMSPCQLEFRVGGSSGGISVPLQTVCFDGSSAQVGPCTPPIAPAAMSGASLPLEVADLSVKPDTGYAGAPGLAISHLLQINAPVDESARITVKSSCNVGTTKYVDIGFESLYAGPFRYESGESVIRPSRLYWNQAFGFTEAPKLCDVSFGLWTPKTGASWGDVAQTSLKKACFRDGAVSDGPCDPAAPASPAMAALTKDSLSVGNPKMQLVAPYGAPGGAWNLSLTVDLTIKTPVDQQTGIDAHATCKVGGATRSDKIWITGVELFYLEGGETTPLSGQAFTSEALAGTPKSCEVRLTAGARFGRPGEVPLELAKFCLKKDKVKPGKC